MAERQDVTVTFVEPRSEAARYALARLPGVIAVEPQRTRRRRVRAGHRERYLADHRRPAESAASSASSIATAARSGCRPSGVVLSLMLADVLGVRPATR